MLPKSSGQRTDENVEPRVNKSLYKALRILNCFTEETPEWGVSELSRALDIGKSSVSTMLNLLSDMDLVQQSPTTRRYQLGLRCLELGYLASSRLVLRDYAYPYLEPLLEGDRIVYLGILHHDEVLYVEALYPIKRRINYSSVGRCAPLYCTAIGKALLAHMPDDYIDSYLENTVLQASTENTLTDAAALREDLKLTRRRRYAIDYQEREYGIQCVSVPVRKSDSTLIAALSISDPSSEINDSTIPQLAEKALSASHNISLKLSSAGF
jgi:DNA-binding IclR family transcriptional regulator